MKYCPHCGAAVSEYAVFCLNCCFSIAQEKQVDHSVSAGLVILAFLIPLFGVIYWPTKAKERPICAKACGIAAIISCVLIILLIAR